MVKFFAKIGGLVGFFTFGATSLSSFFRWPWQSAFALPKNEVGCHREKMARLRGLGWGCWSLRRYLCCWPDIRLYICFSFSGRSSSVLPSFP